MLLVRALTRLRKKFHVQIVFGVFGCLDKFLFKMAGALRRFKPLFDRILVEKFLPEMKTKGGVLLPEKSLAKVLEGTVVAIGPGLKDKDGKNVPVSVDVGDKVLLPEFGGTKINFEDKDYHIYRDGDILGKFED